MDLQRPSRRARVRHAGPTGGRCRCSRSRGCSPRSRSISFPGIGGHIPANGLNPAPTQPIELPGVLLRRARLDRLRGGARAGGAADRDGRRDRLSGHPPGPPRRPARGPAADRRLRDVRRGLVPVRLAGDRRGADDRGGGDRRLAAAPGPRSRAARRRDRLAGLDRPRLVDRRRHERHRDRHGHAARLRPSRPRSTSSGRSPSPRRSRSASSWSSRSAAGSSRSRPRGRTWSCRRCGLAIGGLAILFAQTTDHGIDNVLFSGQETISPLVAHAGDWTHRGPRWR